jgi:tripartite-type tricarboxylate transporter receptor subunit TctC
MVAKGPQDGSTILYTTVAHAVTRAMFPRLPFDPVADFTPVSLVGQVPVILLVHNSFPARNVEEFVRVLRENPGRYDYASSGNGGAVHLATELFMHAAGGLRANHIPVPRLVRRDAGGAVGPHPDDLRHRRLRAALCAVGRAARAGDLDPRTLAAGAQHPDLHRAGVAGYEAYTWHMVLARSGTPAPVIEAINRAVTAAVELPNVQERLTSLAMQVVRGSTPASAAEYLRSEIGVWEPLVRAANIRAD